VNIVSLSVCDGGNVVVSSGRVMRRERGRTLLGEELGKDLEGVGTEVITLSLEEGGRETLGPVAVVEGEGGGESGSGDTPECGLGDDPPPSGLGLVD
jgi:hypothetical protein